LKHYLRFSYEVSPHSEQKVDGALWAWMPVYEGARNERVNRNFIPFRSLRQEIRNKLNREGRSWGKKGAKQKWRK
jgi:hypothetical protein